MDPTSWESALPFNSPVEVARERAATVAMSARRPGLDEPPIVCRLRISPTILAGRSVPSPYSFYLDSMDPLEHVFIGALVNFWCAWPSRIPVQGFSLSSFHLG